MPEDGRLRRNASERALQQCVTSGVDLVQLDVHSDACSICLPLQGKVFSITGRTPGFPAVTREMLPPLHVRCRHVLVGVDPDFLAIRGQLDHIRRFSNDACRVVDSIFNYQDVLAGRSPGQLRDQDLCAVDAGAGELPRIGRRSRRRLF